MTTTEIEREQALDYLGDRILEFVDVATGKLARATRRMEDLQYNDDVDPTFAAELLLDQLEKLQSINADQLRRCIDAFGKAAAWSE